jgi:hypothetical protein
LRASFVPNRFLYDYRDIEYRMTHDVSALHNQHYINYLFLLLRVVMWLKLSIMYNFGGIAWFIYLLAILGSLMLVIYLVKVVLDPVTVIKIDLATPDKIITMGAMAMALCLLAGIVSKAIFAMT